MKAFVEYVVKALVDYPDRVQISAVERNGTEVLELHVDPSDFGKVIGKQGRTCAALRALLSCASGKLGRRVVLDIIEPPGREPSEHEESVLVEPQEPQP